MRVRLRCELCDATLLSQGQLDQHLAGRKHQQRELDSHLGAGEQRRRAEKKLRGLVLGSAADAPGEAEAGDLVAAVRAFVEQPQVPAEPQQEATVADAAAAPASGRVLLYYKYCDVGDPAAARQWQLELCTALRLRGRIHVAAEGVNGTVGGSAEAAALYIAAMERHQTWASVFSGIDYKASDGDASAFPNLFVKCGHEIIALGRSPAEISWRDSAQHLDPAEFHRMLLEHAAQRQRQTSEPPVGPAAVTPDQGDGGRGSGSGSSGSASGGSSRSSSGSDSGGGGSGGGGGNSGSSDRQQLVLLDCRNLYESEIGHFAGAVRCPTRHFTEFPAAADQMIEDLQLRDKTVMMYCTGGIRCERASAYLRSVGVERCFQLKGGIARYCDAFPAATAPVAADTAAACPVESTEGGGGGPESESSGSMFLGKNFVFDRRIALESGGSIVGQCAACGASWDQYDKAFSCGKCAAFVLVCEACRPSHATRQPGRKRKSDSNGGAAVAAEESGNSLMCTYCRKGHAGKLGHVAAAAAAEKGKRREAGEPA